MIVIIGFVIVSAAVIGGYLLEGGNLSVIFQPVEILIIGGAALGGFIIASPMKVIKATGSSIARIFTNKPYTKQDYMEALIMINGIFYKIRSRAWFPSNQMLMRPNKAPVFKKFPNILENQAAITLITDTLRTVMTTTIAPL